MIIEELRLHSRALTRQAALFARRLGLLVEEQTSNRLALRVGQSRLVFERHDRQHGVYHYAVGVPGHRFADAIAWLEARVPLLTNRDGQREFYFDAWNAHAVYFADADGNIAELVAHHTLDSPSSGAFSAHSLLGVNELGVVVAEVGPVVQALEEAYGLQPYLGLSGPEFTAVGDAQGKFIVVTPGRPWLLTGAPARPRWSATTFRVGGQRFTFTTEDDPAR